MVMAQVTRPATQVCTHTILPLNKDICRIKLDFTVSTYSYLVKSFQFKEFNLNFISDFQYSWASYWNNWDFSGHYRWLHWILYQRYIQCNKPWKVCLTFDLWHQYRTTPYDSLTSILLIIHTLWLFNDSTAGDPLKTCWESVAMGLP